MLKKIDDFLNKITMYRLTLYVLFLFFAIALVLGIFKIITISPLGLVVSLVLLLVVCLSTNFLISKALNIPTNIESAYITALILNLLITPPWSLSDFKYLSFIAVAGVIAMASKYILAINRKHLFNPAAFAVIVTFFTLGHSANWWIGTAYMMPFVLVGGFLIVRKLQRSDLVISFLVTWLVQTLFLYRNNLGDVPDLLKGMVLFSPLLFFSLIMLTEPLTTPPNRKMRIFYGILVAILFNPSLNFFNIYSTPEIALVIGNIFSYIVSPKKRLFLKLKEKKQIAQDTYDFSFTSEEKKFDFKPGQYLEWTLGHKKPDSRGNRRYFTIASSPTDKEIHIGVKFYPKPSSFKNALGNMREGDVITASQLSGEFTLPNDQNKKLCFIAGGIGVTPFHSIMDYLLNKKEKRDALMFYSTNTLEDIAYKEIFDSVEKELGIRTVYALAKEEFIPTNWTGERGFITGEMLIKHMPDYKERIYYISGPHAMVTAFEDTLSKMGIPKSHIKIDFFPGFV